MYYIKNGLGQKYKLDTYAARKLKSKCTGNGVLTNILVSSKKPEANLLQNMTLRLCIRMIIKKIYKD